MIYRDMIKYRLNILLIAIISIVTIGCTKNEDTTNTTTSSQTLSLTVKPIDGGSLSTKTTEVVDQESVKNIWVLQFGESGDILNCFYEPDFENNKTKKVTLNPEATTIWVVGNTFNSSLFNNTNCATLELFKTQAFTLDDNIYRESDMWVKNNGTNYLRFSGVWSGEKNTSLIGVVISPLAARISFSYTLTANDPNAYVVLEKIQLVNVPVKCNYTSSSGETFVQEPTNYQSYTITESDAPPTEISGTFAFYIPENKRGVNENTKPSEKSANAPNNATYITVTGSYYQLDEIENKFRSQPISVILYPGGNNYNDYNIELGKNYEVSCNIGCDYYNWQLKKDSRVNTSVKLPQEGLFVHYEFDPNNHNINSAYKTDGATMVNTWDITDSYDYNSSERDLNNGYWAGCKPTNGETLAENVTDTDNDGLQDGEFNDLTKVFMRNLAKGQGITDFDPTKYDCRDIYNDDYKMRTNNPYLTYTDKDNYMESNALQLNTGWGDNLNPQESEFTIVFIGSLNGGSTYYGNVANGMNYRWYLYRMNGALQYGMAGGNNLEIPNIRVGLDEPVFVIDVCGKDELNTMNRVVYFRNVDVKNVPVPDYEFNRNIHIFGHKTATQKSGNCNSDTAKEAKLYMFLIYNRALTTEEIDKIKTYATLKNII